MVLLSEPKAGAVPKSRKLILPLALEAGPLLAFFLANALYGIMTATAIVMAATVIAVVLSRWAHGRLPVVPLLSCLVGLVLGATTLWLDEAMFIKLKPTIVNLMFGLGLLAGMAARLDPLKRAFGDLVTLRDGGWRTLELRAGLFLIALAVLNEIVWRGFSTDIWVTFKVFAILPLDILFVASQYPLIRRNRLE